MTDEELEELLDLEILLYRGIKLSEEQTKRVIELDNEFKHYYRNKYGI